MPVRNNTFFRPANCAPSANSSSSAPSVAPTNDGADSFTVPASGGATQEGVSNNITRGPVRTGSAATQVPPQPSSQAAQAPKTIDWFSYWHPVVPVDDVDLSRPLAADLLGMKLVLWKDSKGQWHCQQDTCPHRLAPLSEGIVMGDRLTCSYHGWEFDAAGKCVAIPQIEDPKALATACSSPRNCLKTYPVKVVHGLLWVYPRAGAQGVAEAAAQPVPKTALPALLECEADPQASIYYQSTKWFWRDMPIRFDTLMENCIDVSHVYFSHHGAPGVNRSQLVNPRMEVAPDGALTKEGGFTVTRGAVGSSPASQFGLVPPHLASYTYPHSQSHFYCVPTKPGWSRVLTCMIGRKDVEIPKALQAMSKLMARFPVIEHVLLRHEILDGDLYLLHAGERALLDAGNKVSSYYMPANADLAVLLWRQWLSRYGGQVPTCSEADAPLMPPLMPKEQVLDRYHQHTRNCKTCQAALRNLDRTVTGATGVGVAALVLGLVSLATKGVTVAGVAGLLAAASCAGLCSALAKARQKFFFVDYVHAHVYARK